MKRIKLSKEPQIKLSKWVIADKVYRGNVDILTNYHYFSNREEMRAYMRKAKKGHVLQVVQIRYNFVEAWEV